MPASMSDSDIARIIELRRAGKTFAEIAVELGCSQKTVQSYLQQQANRKDIEDDYEKRHRTPVRNVVDVQTHKASPDELPAGPPGPKEQQSSTVHEVTGASSVATAEPSNAGSGNSEPPQPPQPPSSQQPGGSERPKRSRGSPDQASSALRDAALVNIVPKTVHLHSAILWLAMQATRDQWGWTFDDPSVWLDHFIVKAMEKFDIYIGTYSVVRTVPDEGGKMVRILETVRTRLTLPPDYTDEDEEKAVVEPSILDDNGEDQQEEQEG